MKSAVGRGVVVLTISGIVCKLIGAFFRLPLSNILGIEGIGVFQLVMSVYSFALVLISGGLSVTLSKLISTERARRDYKKIKWHIYVAASYSLVISFVFGLMFLFFSKKIAFFQNSIDAAFSYKFFLPLLVCSSLVSLFRGVYQGYENMTPTAISQILEQVCKFVFSLFFARWFLKFSLAAAVAGAVLGILVGEVLALVYLVLSRYSLNLRKYKVEIGNRKEFFSYFFPATLGLAVSSSAHFIDSLAIVNRLVVAGIEKGKAISLFGLQSGMVGSILNFPVTISLAVSAALLPTLSYKFKENAAKKNGTARTSFSIMWFAILPMTFGLVAVSFPLYKIIYPFLSDDFLFVAIKLTALGSISSLFFALSQFFVTILQARGDFRFVLASQLAGAVVKILCTVFLCAIPSINIYGIAIGNIVLSFIVAAACLFKVRKDFAFDIDEFFIPLLSSLVMLVVASMVATIVRNVYLAVVAAIVVGAAVYLLLTIPLLLRFKSLFLGKKKKGGTNEQRGTY